MKDIFYKGLILFVYSTIYITLSFLYFSFLWESKLVIIEILIGLGFIFFWFYYGFKIKQGFKKGLLIGTIGAIGGILLVVISLLLMINTKDGQFLFVMIPWSYPLIGIYSYLPHYGTIDYYLSHISVILVILLTAVGSWLGGRNQS